MAHEITKIKNFGYAALNKEIMLSDLSASKKKDDKEAVEQLERMFKAYNDDFWQGGDGSLLPPARGSEASVIGALLKKRFVFRNVIRECVERVSGAFFS